MTTPCDRFAEAVDALVDGTLDAGTRARVEAHLEVCADCRALVEDLRELRSEAANLVPHPLPESLWPRVAARLRAAGAGQEAPGASTGAARHWFAIAALLVLTVGAALFLTWSSRSNLPAQSTGGAGNGTGGSSVQGIEAELRLAEEHYERAIKGLEEIAVAEENPLEPHVAETMKRNLQVIDQAIAESRSALKTQPQNQPARESLFEALRRKVALLQDSIVLMNEMRKGNQAGAAQIGEGLNESF